MMTLGNYDQATYQTEINWMGYFLAATQDAGSGGWVYSSNNHYPEVGGENTAGLYFTTSGVTDVIVDDDFTGQADVDAYNSANGTSYVWGYDAFATIADGIDAVSAGGTVTVQPGTYAENVNIDKAVSLIGDSGAKAQPEIAPGSGVAVVISTSNITIQNFAIHDAAQGILGWLDDTEYNLEFGYQNIQILDNTIYNMSNGAWGFGIYLGTESERYDPSHGMYDPSLTDLLDFTGLLIDGNELYNCSGASITLQSMRSYDSNPLLVSDNNSHDNAMSGLWIDGAWDFEISGNTFAGNANGMFLSNYGDGAYEGTPDNAFDPQNFDVHDNVFSGNTSNGVAIYDGYLGTMDFYYNDFLSNGTNAYNYLSPAADFEQNWWGSIHYSVISGTISGNIDFDPWCHDATHTICTLTYPVTEVWVDDDWAGSSDGDVVGGHVFGYDAFATITDGMNGVTGSTVNVAAGTYYETLNITTAGLEIIGENEATVIVDPTGLATNNAGIYVAADNVTLKYLTLDATIANSLPRYGVKVADVDGCVIEGVTATDVYRSGFDCLGSGNLTLTGLTTTDNGGHGLALTDCNGVDVTDFYADNNGWQNVSVATWGRYTPLGCSDIVFSGSNTFGDLFQLEMGDYNNPGVPPAGAAIITYSTDILDGADVTVQASDFGYALHGEQDDSPDQVRICFFSTLTNAAVIPGMGGPVGHWTGNDMFIESLTDDTQLYVTPGCDIAAAIDFADAGDYINIMAGNYTLDPQTVIDKDLNIVGETAKSLVTITPTGNTGSSGDARGWFVVNDGVTFNLSNVTLDGSGYLIYQAIRCKGGGIYSNISFQSILYNESGPTYGGVAIAVFPGTQLPVRIDGCDFANIGRVGALLWYVSDCEFTNNTYTGKGDGDWLDYAIDMNSGANVVVNDNTITDCRGVASSDGSGSAGLLITTYYGAGTAMNGEGNTVKNCTNGLAVGYDASDGSTVTLTNGNRFLDNDYGIVTSASASIGLTIYGNTFANTVNAEDNTAGGSWDDGASVGNCWSDFASNSGYPTHYLVGGSAGAIDNYPNTDCGIAFEPDDILYHCDGDFDIDVGIGNGVLALEGAEITIEYPAELTLVSVTEADPNYFLAHSLTDNASGTDVLLVNLGVKTGWQDGPADLFTVTLNGATDYCTGAAIAMTDAELRDTANSVITMPLPGDITLVADCEDPVLTVNTTDGDCYNVPPVVNLEATDNCDLDAVYYQINGCGGAGWNLLAGSLSGTNWGPNDYVMSAADFMSLSEGAHCVYFKVIDDNGRGNVDSCDCWSFTKATQPPAAPTNLFATPGHNKVNLSWTNVTTDFDHVVVMRSDWNASGSGYPEYGSPDAGTPEGPYPDDTSSYDLVYAGSANTLEDTDDISNTTRDIYHYTVFTVDCAGNISTPVSTSRARATSYWLGDIAGPGGSGDYDGFVYAQDLNVFSFSYWTGPLATFWNAECDFGPTVDAKGGPKGIPVPDDSVEFEDLIIFAINYDDVSPTFQKDRPILAGSPHTVGTKLRLKGRIDGNSYLVDVFLDNAEDLAKAFDAELSFDSEQLRYVSTERGQSLTDPTLPIFFKATGIRDRVYLSAAVLGEELTFTGSGQVATVRFELGGSGNAVVKLAKSVIRGADNENVNTGTSLADASTEIEVPVTYVVKQNHPNPFNPITDISYGLPISTQVSIKVYNVRGQLVKTLVDSYQPAGMHRVQWDATNESGARVASGVYFYRFETVDFQKTIKMTLLK
jgi:hypothetical protein